jgi:hypothetical protein
MWHDVKMATTHLPRYAARRGVEEKEEEEEEN